MIAYLAVSVSRQLEPSRQKQIGHKLDRLRMLKTNDLILGLLSLFSFIELFQMGSAWATQCRDFDVRSKMHFSVVFRSRFVV